jgi:hypothetical protein
MNSRARLLVVLVGLSVVGAGCKSNPGCDLKQLNGLEQALKSGSLDPSQRMTMGMTGLAEACGDQLPSGITKAMQALGSAEPDTRAMKVAQGLEDATSFCEAACPKFKQVFAQVAADEPATKGQRVYAGCGYQALGLVTQEEFDAAAKRDFLGTFIAMPLYKWLVDHKVEQAQARGLMRSVLGL